MLSPRGEVEMNDRWLKCDARDFGLRRLFVAVICLLAYPGFSQTHPVEQWTGSIQCQLDLQLPGYARQEVQTWTLTGEPGKPAGGAGTPLYPATWTYTGQGQLERPDGTMAQWTINPEPGYSELVLFLRPSDRRFIIKLGRSQPTLYNALHGTRQAVASGVVTRTDPVTYAVHEWEFPWIETTPGPNLSGTFTVPTESFGGSIASPQSGPPPPAQCKYQFVKAGASTNATLVNQNCANASNTGPTFDAMKSNLAQQFESLIQQIQDATKKATLASQERRLLGEIDRIKVQTSGPSAQPCPPDGTTTSAQNSSGTGTSSGNAERTPPSQPPVNSNSSQSTPDGTTQVSASTGAPPASSPPSTPFGGVAPPVNGMSSGTPRTVAQSGSPTFTTLPNSPQPANAAAAPTADVTGTQVTTTQAPTGISATPTAPSPGMTSPRTKTVSQKTFAGLATTPIPPASTAQPPASGKYLVTMTGLWCVHPTQDDPFDTDGHGDEIYAAAFVRKYDRTTNENTLSYSRQTLVYGDSNRSDRIQAGTQTGLGGIRAFDSIPINATADRRVSPQNDGRFPYKLWGGTLTDGADVLVISPSIWESDGKPGLLSGWVAKQNESSSNILLDSKVQDLITTRTMAPVTVGAIAAGTGSVTAVTRSVFDVHFVLLGIPPITMLMSGADRPIGLIASDADTTAFPNTLVVLTREMIEAALSNPARPLADAPAIIPTPKPGILAITFSDSGLVSQVAQYVMTIQVERCEGSLLQYCAD